MGHSGHVQDIPGLLGTLDGIEGLEPSRVGHSGHVQDVPRLHKALGWDAQWEWSCLEWDSRDMSRVSLGFPQIWDGMDSGIGAL